MSLNNVDIGFSLNKSGSNNLFRVADKTYTAEELNDALTGSGGNPDQQNIIYVGKHGSDANDGLTIEKAKLTFGGAEAIRTVNDCVVCLDAGIYNENLNISTPGSIFAPNAILNGVAGSRVISANSSSGEIFITFNTVIGNDVIFLIGLSSSDPTLRVTLNLGSVRTTSGGEVQVISGSHNININTLTAGLTLPNVGTEAFFKINTYTGPIGFLRTGDAYGQVGVRFYGTVIASP